MRPLALFVLVAILAGCSACATGGKTPEPANHFYQKGARALTGADRLATRGCTQKAVTSYFKAVELFTLADDQEALAACFNNIGNLYLGNGQNAEALLYYRQARAIHTLSGNTEGEVRVLTNMAAAQLADGATAEAETHLNRAKAIASREGIARPQMGIVRANLMRKTGNTAEALTLLQAVATTVKASDTPLAASLYFAMGRSYVALKRYEEGLTKFSDALAVDRHRGALGLMVRDLREMSRCLAALNQKKEAAWHLERALGIATLLGAEPEQKAIQNELTNLTGETKASPISGYFMERWTQGESYASPCD